MQGTWTHAGPQGRIGRYVVEAKLGEGGMASTWLCRLHGAQGFSKQAVAKILRPECHSAEHQTMFADEARIGARLEHPNIPRVLEFGQSAEGPFLIQEYVDGPNLTDVMNRQSVARSLDPRFAARVVADVASALHHAYHSLDEQGRPLQVIHRDVSPSNILVSRRGTTKLIDFGVAMFANRETRTEAGILKGKLRYMAPEVLLHGDISHQADLYSLGIVLYSLCMGEPPWGPSGTNTASAINGASQRVGSGSGSGMSIPSMRRMGVDPVLEGIIQRCLHTDRSQRYATGRELELALHTWLERNGGPMTDADQADRLMALFPEGASHWRPEHSSIGTSSTIQKSRSVRLQPLRNGRWLFGATLLVLFLAISTLVVTVGAAAWVAVQLTRSEEAAPSVASPSGSADSGPEIERAIAGIRQLAETDLEAAIQRSRVLMEMYPDSLESATLLAELTLRSPAVPQQIAPAEPEIVPAPTAAAAPRPLPKPPRPPPPNDLLGKRTGRAPTAETEPSPAPAERSVPSTDVVNQRQR